MVKEHDRGLKFLWDKIKAPKRIKSIGAIATDEEEEELEFEEENDKMAESQSRYSIMEQLSNRKMNENEKLSNLRQARRVKEIEHEKKKCENENTQAVEERNYKPQHEAWKRVKLLEKEELEQELKQKINALDEQIKDADGNFEKKHKDRMSYLKRQSTQIKNDFDEWIEKQDAKIKAKEQSIKDIEKAITDLKQMSKEQEK